MIVFGLMLFASLGCMIGLVVSNILLMNRVLKEEQERKNKPWTWD